MDSLFRKLEKEVDKELADKRKQQMQGIFGNDADVMSDDPVVPIFGKGENKLVRISTMQQLELMKERSRDKMFVLLFWAKWYPECEILRQHLEKLCANLSHLMIGWVDVDHDKSVVMHFEIKKVPFLLLMHPSKHQCEYIKEPRVTSLAKVLGAYEEFYRESFANEKKEAFAEIEEMLSTFPIVMYIRGSTGKPSCRSSKALVD